MAWTGPIENVEAAVTTGAGTNHLLSPAATIPIGTLIVMGWTSSINSATAATCSDNSSQAGTANSYNILATQTTTGPSFQGGMIWCVTTRSILSSDVITIVGGSSSRRDARLTTWTGNAASPLDTSANQANTTVSPYAIGPLGPLAETNELVVACAFVASAAHPIGYTDSTTGYTAIVGTSTLGTGTPGTVCMSYKKTAGTAAETDTQSYSGTFSKAIGQIIAFKQASAVTNRYVVFC